MNKNKSRLIAMLTLMSTSTVIHAQAFERVTSAPSFTETVFGGGIFSILLYLVIFSFLAITIPLGITSIVQSFNKKRIHMPLSTKLLICTGVASILLGMLGFILNFVSVFYTLATATGAVKAALLSMAISASLQSIALGLVTALFSLFFITISLIAFHKSHRNNDKDECGYNK